MPVAYAGLYVAMICIAAVYYSKFVQHRDNNVAGINLEATAGTAQLPLTLTLITAGIIEVCSTAQKSDNY